MFKSVYILCCVLLCFVSPCLADQDPFGPYHGRTNQILVERSQFGDIDTVIFLNARMHDSTQVSDLEFEYLGSGYYSSTLTVYAPAPQSFVLPNQISARCEGRTVSQNSHCTAIRAINSCNWSSLSTDSKATLTFLLGSCTKQCITGQFTQPWGETVTSYSWSCVNPAQAECVLLAGMGSRIDLMQRAGGCQF